MDDGRFEISGVVFQDLLVQGIGFVRAILRHEELNVGPLHAQILGMRGQKRREFRQGFLGITYANVIVTEHAVPAGIVAHRALSVRHGALGIRIAAAGQIKSSQRAARRWILRSGLNRRVVLLLGLRPASLLLIKITEEKARRQKTGIHGNGFLKTRFRLGQLFHFNLNQSQGDVSFGTAWSILNRFLNFFRCKINVPKRCVRVGQIQLRVETFGLYRQRRRGPVMRILRLARGQQEFCQVGQRVRVLGLQIDGEQKFLIGAIPDGFSQVGLRQLVMGFRKTLVQLNRVFKIDGGFAIFFRFQILHALLEIFLFFDIRIARRTPRKQYCRNSAGNPCTNQRSFPVGISTLRHREQGFHSDLPGKATKFICPVRYLSRHQDAI